MVIEGLGFRVPQMRGTFWAVPEIMTIVVISESILGVGFRATVGIIYMLC